MKSILFTILFAFCSIPLLAQTNTPVPQFEKVVHNYGEILESNGPVTAEFKVKNTGDVPLIITRVATSCGCTASNWTREPILPETEGFVNITYDPRGRPGAINQRITVFTNAPGSGIVLSLRGQVLPREKTKEEIYRRRIGDLGLTNSHASLGIVYVDQQKTDTLKMYNFGKEKIEVSFDRVPKHITVTPVPSTLAPGQEGEIIVSFDAKGVDDWGYSVSRATVMVNKQRIQGNIINISARIEEDFSKLTKQELDNAPKIEFSEITKDFGNVDEGDVIEHEFVFTNAGKSDLVIRKIQASCGCTTVAPKVTVIKPGEQSSLSASFRTRGFTGRQSKTITVITNDPKSSNVVLRLTGTVNKK